MKAAGRRKLLRILIDGLDPAYLERSDMPNLRRLIAAGSYRVWS
jgi:predicted AlkP superfamily pyrophosphatase or phosphodiesterase